MPERGRALLTRAGCLLLGIMDREHEHRSPAMSAHPVTYVTRCAEPLVRRDLIVPCLLWIALVGCHCSPPLTIHYLAADHSEQHSGLLDIIDRAAQEIAIDYDQIRQLANFETPLALLFVVQISVVDRI
jgi:hypothetical protein